MTSVAPEAMGTHGVRYKAWSIDCRKIRGEWNLNGAQSLDYCTAAL